MSHTETVTNMNIKTLNILQVIYTLACKKNHYVLYTVR